MALDLGYTENNESVDTESVNENTNENVTDLNTGKLDSNSNGENVDNLNDQTTANHDQQDDNNQPSTGDDTKLEAGTVLEVGNETYTVDESGNILDKNGNIYKEANQANEWIKSFESVDEVDNEISIDSVREAIGIDITDDNNKLIEFENSVNGIKAYVDAVVETAKEEHFETAINTLYQKYPILEEVLNYYIANGNSLEGFNDIPDRSNINIDESNEQQHEAIIKAAWKERNQRGDVDSYIAYLKSSGILYATAKEELEALQESDRQYREEIAAEAEKKENQRIADLEKYWNGVHDVIKSRSIAGYQIPESIIINRNNQKISVTPNDFFDYIYRVDKNGKSAYERDLENETMESRRDDEILRAYLKFIGGNYSNLVDMAINKEKVNKLKLRAKERNTASIRISKPKVNNKQGTDIDLGYN